LQKFLLTVSETVSGWPLTLNPATCGPRRTVTTHSTS
jgi:hypothetical protein